jgi:hypothetical protein
MWVNIPDTPQYGYPNMNPPRNEHGFEDPRVAIRFYKSVIAEEDRKVKKAEEKKKNEEKEKHKTFWHKLTPGRVSMILFFTWPLIGIGLVYELKLLLTVLETTFTK